MGCWQLGQLDTHKPCLSTSFSRCKGHNGPFQPRLWEGKVRELLLCASPISPAAPETKHLPEGLQGAKGKQGHHHPKPGSWSTPWLSCFLASHALGSTASDTGREGPAEGSQHSLFSLCTAKEFLLCGAGFGTFQRRAAPAPPVPCRGSRRDRSSPGTGSVPPAQGQGQGGGHKDLKGWAVLRGVWHNTVHVKSNPGHDGSD